MMKIAILGTENSHATAFAKLIKEDPAFADVELIGVYGYSEEANRKLVEAGLVSRVAETPDAFLNEVDGIVITARHGDHHYEYGLPYLKKGIPAFIDKPFAITPAQCAEMVAAATASGAPVCGGSSLKFLDEVRPLARFCARQKAEGKIVAGQVGAPIDMVNPYGGFYFYAQHLVEILLTIFGEDVCSVQAFCRDKEKNDLQVLFHYPDFTVVGQYYASYQYTATVFGKEDLLSMHVRDVSYCYKAELQEFTDMVKTGVQPHSFARLLLPARLLTAMEQSYLTGEKVAL